MATAISRGPLGRMWTAAAMQNRGGGGRTRASTMAVVCPGDVLPPKSEAQAPAQAPLAAQVHASAVGTYSDSDGVTRAALLGVWDGTCVRKRARAAIVVPAVGDVVVGRVVRITPRMAEVEVVCIAGGGLLRDSCTGTIRKEDVRTHDVDSVELHSSFRPGDVIKARVISLGDARALHLSTARMDLGVILAKGIAGVNMAPVSYREMVCPKTGTRERRKVARLGEAHAS